MAGAVDLARATEQIARTEARFDVASVEVDGVRAWPLVRACLWNQTLHGVQAPAPAWRRAASRVAGALRGLAAAQRPLPDLEPRDLVFFARREDHVERIEGRPVDRHLDPLIDLARGRWSHHKLELAGPGAAPERFEDTTFLGTPEPQRFFPRDLSGLEPLLAVLAETAPGFVLDPHELRLRVGLLRSTEALAAPLLERLRPKAVLLACYYDPRQQGVVRACRRAGLPVVDVQHGKQGRHHGLYTHWTRVPDDRYGLLPRAFWSWGEESAENVRRWLPPGTRDPALLVGGYRWLGWWREGRAGTAGDRARADGRVEILVTLQPLADPLPRALLGAIRGAPSDWRWRVRLHPQQAPRAAELARRLGAGPDGPVAVHRASDAPLYEVLRGCSHHVTGWSSVGYEALAFGVPTTLIHPVASSLYEDYLRRGHFRYAEDADALLRSIATPPAPGELDEDTPYIECSAERARAALEAAVALGEDGPGQALG